MNRDGRMTAQTGASVVFLAALLLSQSPSTGLHAMALPAAPSAISDTAGAPAPVKGGEDAGREDPVALACQAWALAGGFVPNLGQIKDPEVLFHTGGARFTSSGVVFRVAGEGHGARPPLPPLDASRLYGRAVPTGSSLQSTAWVYRMDFDGANRVLPEGLGDPIYRSSFYIGRDPARWVSGAPAYSGIVYRNLYDGIDLVFRTVAEGLKYEFIVAPGADPSRIRLRYEGAQVSTDGSSLLVSTPAGVVREGELLILKLPPPGTGGPILWPDPLEGAADSGGGDVERVDGRVVVEGNTVGYIVARDPRRTLVIDPLIFSTYIGGWGDDRGLSIALSPSGTVYVAGETGSLDFPSTPGAYQENPPGSCDIVVLELSSDGTSLLRATYFGGSLEDRAGELGVGADGSLCLVGSTFSPDLPVTPGCPDGTLGGDSDAFVAVLTPDCARLNLSTYLGGSSSDSGDSLAPGQGGTVYVAGQTLSADFPVTPGALNLSHPGTGDAFVAHISPDAGILISSVFGGASWDRAASVRIDSEAAVIVVGGATRSPDFPTTNPVYDRTQNGESDVFIARGSFVGNSPILQSTFLGGWGDDFCTGIALDPEGAVHITGCTYSNNFPVTINALSLHYSGYGDAFETALSRDLGALVHSTYIGGHGRDLASSIALDTDGSALLTGETGSASTFPVTPDALQPCSPGGTDAFLLKLLNGSTLAYSTFLGGAGCETGEALALDLDGVAYLTGRTNSPDFPVSGGCWDGVHNGGGDFFVLALRPPDPPGPPRIVDVRAGPGEVGLRWLPPEHDGRSPILGYRIYRGAAGSNLSLLAGVDSRTTDYRDTGVHNGTTYLYALSAFNRFEEGAMSEAVRATPESVPGPPLNLTARPNDRTVILYWSPPESDGGWRVSGYGIYRGREPGSLSLCATRNADATTYQDIGLENGVSYFYAVSAFNKIGEGPRTEAVGATPGFPPGPPKELRAEGVGAFIELRWEPPDFDGYNRILGYSVYRRERGSVDTVVARPGPGETLWRDGPLEPGRGYSYYLTALNAVGESPPSSVVTAAADAAPSPPQDVLAVSRSGPIELVWAGPVSDGGSPVLFYNVYRAEGTTELFEHRARVDGAHHFLDLDIAEGRRYFYRVSAVNEMGEGPPSEAASAVADSTPPMLSIREPAEGAFLGRGRVLVSGPAWDSNGLLRVEVLSGGTHPAGLSGGNWSCGLELGEGRHAIVAVATDVAGNLAVASLNVTVDLTPPEVCITQPAPGALTGSRWMVVEGLARDNFALDSVEVSAGGAVWFPAAGAPGWRALVEAGHGELEVLAMATDAAGNAAVARVNVTNDIEPPRVELVDPGDGERIRVVGTPFITRARVSASDDRALARVELSTDGIRWVPARLDLYWIADVVLDRGEQVICARAVDTAGNERYHNITVFVETSVPGPPPLGIIAPALAACAAASVLFGALIFRRGRGRPPQPLN